MTSSPLHWWAVTVSLYSSQPCKLVFKHGVSFLFFSVVVGLGFIVCFGCVLFFFFLEISVCWKFQSESMREVTDQSNFYSL